MGSPACDKSKIELIMASNAISDGIEGLCLNDDLHSDKPSLGSLGAIPKSRQTPASPNRDVPPSVTSSPATARKTQKKKNRKDRRRSDNEASDSTAKTAAMSKVEKLRVERGLQRSQSDRRVAPSSQTTPAPDVATLLFK